LQSPQSSRPLTSRDPGDIIAHGPDGEISVGQFVARAIELAGRLPDHRYVINLAADRYQFFLGFCAAVIAGQCTLMPSNRQQQTVQQAADEYPDCYLMGETTAHGIERFDADFDDLGADTVDVEIPEIPLHQLCAIVFTSGSTGAATPNRKYWETIRTSTLSNVDLLIRDQKARLNLVATVPPQHMWGFETSILMPLFSNIAVSHITPFFPQDIVDALESLPEPRALVSSPVHVDALLSANVDRIRIHRIFSATAPMSAELARQLEQRFDARVIEIFGCSEAGTFARRFTASERLWRLSNTFDLDVGQDRVVIRASHLPEDVVLHDVVELVGEDKFRWLGRDQDMVNIAGKRGSLADLNHRLTALPGVVDGVFFMPDENSKRLAALVVAPGLQASDILEQLKPAIEPAFLPRPVYIVPMLPRQETGKLARKMLVQLFEQTQRIRAQQDEGPTDS
jgi:acyl-coenzyme A synthetase/AMP-(fatty) acid ligase